MQDRRPARVALAQTVLRPFREFIALEASGGILLLAATACALLWANSPWAESYTALWQMYLHIGVPGAQLSKPLILWINDGLMAIFFFVIGLEIKRELLSGSLSSVRQAALPAAAAFGGAAVPALIYIVLTAGGEGADGWGIPMATDIAFALGVLALLGRRAPLSLKVFLAALAVVDDILAVLVIAIFLTAQISWAALGIAAVVMAGLVAVNRAGVQNPLVYIAGGVVLWVAVLQSGVHATVAGVLLAMTIPASAGRHAATSSSHAEAATDDHESHSTLHTLEHALLPWVAYGIMPIFALANAGVALTGGMGAALLHPVSVGIVVGLAVGKPVGIMLAAWLAVRSGLAAFPADLTWQHILGAGFLGGIGFTMSLFIAGLALDTAALLNVAKMGILGGSLVAGVVGFTLLSRMKPVREQTITVETAEEPVAVTPGTVRT